MYGIINKAIQELIIEKYDEETWEDILNKSSIDEKYFLTTEIYRDDVTFNLLATISEVLKVDVQNFLISLGEYWIFNVTKDNYGHIIDAGGNNYREFLENIPYLHNRIALMFPEISAPDFKISDVNENSLCVHYYSQRPGFKNFVRGQLKGLSKYFDEKTQIEVIESRDGGFDHEIYKINWLK